MGVDLANHLFAPGLSPGWIAPAPAGAEPSVDAFSLRSDVKSSVKILSVSHLLPRGEKLAVEVLHVRLCPWCPPLLGVLRGVRDLAGLVVDPILQNCSGSVTSRRLWFAERLVD